MFVRSLSSGPCCRFLCVLLSFSMVTGPALVAEAQQPAAGAPVADVTPLRERGLGNTTLLAAPHAGKIDLTYVSPSAVAVVVLRPGQVMTAEATQMLPVEVASAAGLKYLGIDPADVTEIVAFVEAPLAGPPQYGITIKLAKPLRGSNIPEELRAHTQPGEMAGRKYLQSTEPMLPSMFAPDAQTLIVAPDVTLRRLLKNADKPKSGPLVNRIHNVAAGSDLYLAVDLATLRPLIGAGLAMAAAQVPPEMQPFLEAPNLMSLVELTLNLSNSGPTSLVIRANDEAAAQRLVKLAGDAVDLWRQQMLAAVEAEMARAGNEDDPIAQAYLRYMKRMAEMPVESLPIEQDGTTVTVFHAVAGDSQQQQLVTVAVIGVLVGAAVAGRAGRPRSSPAESVVEQPEAVESCAAGLCRHSPGEASCPRDLQRRRQAAVELASADPAVH